MNLGVFLTLDDYCGSMVGDRVIVLRDSYVGNFTLYEKGPYKFLTKFDSWAGIFILRMTDVFTD